MCLCISSPDGGKTELTFVQEQIFLKKNGSKDIRIDLLIKNVGLPPIQRFRIELPCRLLTDKDFNRFLGETTEEQAFKELCHEQCNKVSIDTTRLIARDAPHNWVYKILPHFTLGDYDIPTGYLHATRDQSEHISGLIKHDWKVAVSKDLGDDPARWFACNANGITVVDFVASPDKRKEFLKPAESMWISVRFTVPRGGTRYVQLPSLLSRVFGRNRSFPVILMSPRAFIEWRTNQLLIFGRKVGVNPKTQAAASSVLSMLNNPNLPEIRDWRLFLHWSSRITISRTKISGEVVEPPMDHILQTNKPKWYTFKRDPGPCADCRNEFWFGNYHGVSEPTSGIFIELKAIVDNLLYNYVFPWLGVLGFIFGVISLLLAFYRYINFLIYGKG